MFSIKSCSSFVALFVTPSFFKQIGKQLSKLRPSHHSTFHTTYIHTELLGIEIVVDDTLQEGDFACLALDPLALLLHRTLQLGDSLIQAVYSGLLGWAVSMAATVRNVVELLLSVRFFLENNCLKSLTSLNRKFMYTMQTKQHKYLVL